MDTVVWKSPAQRVIVLPVYCAAWPAGTAVAAEVGLPQPLWLVWAALPASMLILFRRDPILTCLHLLLLVFTLAALRYAAGLSHFDENTLAYCNGRGAMPMVGVFGGKGFILQRFEGPGTFFVAFDGEIVEYTLNPGETLKVDTGHVAMFEPTVQFDVEMVKGFRNILFGGEGLFLAKLVGPGRIWLQSMPMSKLAGAIKPFFPAAEGSRERPGLNIKSGWSAPRRARPSTHLCRAREFKKQNTSAAALVFC